MIRKELAKRLAIRVKGRKGFIDSRDLGEKIFYEYKNMRIYRKIINREIRKMVRDKISKLKGIICVEWSQLLEDDLLPVVQGHVLWLYCTRKQQIERLSSSNSRLPWEQIKRRIAFQALSTNKMRGNINAEKVKVISFNTTGNPPKENYRGLFDRVLNSFGGAV
jgi:dephospho-CoA kinase